MGSCRSKLCRRILLALLIAIGPGACKGGGGSVSLVLRVSDAGPLPTHLDFVGYNDTGAIVRSRVPKTGTLSRRPGGELGSVVIFADPAEGPLRLHARSADPQGRVLEGALIVELRSQVQVRASLLLEGMPLSDADGDGVPDAIDACPGVADPAQRPQGVGCPARDDSAPGGAANGAPCSAASDCASQFCVDGVCCEDVCDGPCRSCALAGRTGACSVVPAGSDPRDACAETPAVGCGQDGACDGAGRCRLHAPGTICREPACGAAADALMFASVCDGAGQCTPSQPGSCAPYPCFEGACRERCVNDSQCLVGNVCVDGRCGRKPLGRACQGDAECATDHCVDGVCCQSACDSVCRACDLPGSMGLCAAMPFGADGRGRCPVTSPDTCGTDGRCDGKGACAFHALATACGMACEDGAIASLACNGVGQCETAQLTSCHGYACEALLCEASCLHDGDCASTHECKEGVCSGRLPPGAVCTLADQCAARNCTPQGVCCPLDCDTPGCKSEPPACGAQYGFECNRDGFYVNLCCYETLADLGPLGQHVACGARSLAVGASFDLAQDDPRRHRGEIRRDFAATNLVGKTMVASVYVDGPAVRMNVNLVIITEGSRYRVVKGLALAAGWNHVSAPILEEGAEAATGAALQFYLTRPGDAWAGTLHVDEVGWR